MINNIPKPNISQAFTVEDIHIIREWNYARLRDATVDERLADNKRRAAAAQARIEQKRRTKSILV
jgi:hypothetical protein